MACDVQRRVRDILKDTSDIIGNAKDAVDIALTQAEADLAECEMGGMAAATLAIQQRLWCETYVDCDGSPEKKQNAADKAVDDFKESFSDNNPRNQ